MTVFNPFKGELNGTAWNAAGDLLRDGTWVSHHALVAIMREACPSLKEASVDGLIFRARAAGAIACRGSVSKENGDQRQYMMLPRVTMNARGLAWLWPGYRCVYIGADFDA
jgi:hypothetical protein